MPFDVSKYRHHMDGTDLSDEQKDEQLRALCLVLEYFADRAFGIDPVQTVHAITHAGISNHILEAFARATDGKSGQGGGI